MWILVSLGGSLLVVLSGHPDNYVEAQPTIRKKPKVYCMSVSLPAQPTSEGGRATRALLEMGALVNRC